jgi:hypothetical protein
MKFITKLFNMLPAVKRLVAIIENYEESLASERKNNGKQVRELMEAVDTERLERAKNQVNLTRAEHDARIAWQDQAAALEKLRLQKALRNVAWPKPANRLAPSTVRVAFDVGQDDPFWQALHQELDDAITEALDEVSKPPSATLTSEQRLHIAGGVEFLRLFQKQLLDLRHLANHADAELEDEKEAS